MKYAVDFNVYTLYTTYVEADDADTARELATELFNERSCTIEDENIEVDIYEIDL